MPPAATPPPATMAGIGAVPQAKRAPISRSNERTAAVELKYMPSLPAYICWRASVSEIATWPPCLWKRANSASAARPSGRSKASVPSLAIGSSPAVASRFCVIQSSSPAV